MGGNGEQGTGAPDGHWTRTIGQSSRASLVASARDAHIPRSMRYKLTSTDGGQHFELREGAALVIGRAPTSDIPIFDPTISRRHAEVRVEDQGVFVRDLGSSNGTFLNGLKIESSPLRLGDVVTFGK